MFNEGLKEPGEYLGTLYRHTLRKEKTKGKKREWPEKWKRHYRHRNVNYITNPLFIADEFTSLRV